MPAHVYQRIGRYADAVEVNRKAATVDDRYIGRAQPFGYYPSMYSAHNHMFRAYSAAMEGRGVETIEAARKSVGYMSEAILTMMPGMDFYASESYLALVRFGRWDEMLKEPAPKPAYQVLTGLWRFARGMAYAGKGKPQAAAGELAKLRELHGRLTPDVSAGYNTAHDVLGLAARLLEGQIAWKQRRTRAALAILTDAVAREDALAYDEPADWFYPARHHLGAALLAAGRAADAEAVYRDDLKRNPENGWALFGLAKSLTAQKKNAEAADVQARFANAWARADVRLTASCF
jgi:tetratricopeptide (TPR) repeat protein